MTHDTPTFEPETHWQTLKDAMQQGGGQAVVAAIEAFDDPSHQRKLYAFAVSAFDGREWTGNNFDAQIEVARAAIDLGLRQAEAETDPEEKAKRIEFSNVMSYNFSANLAGCWPGVERPREPRHFEAGLRAAEDCLRWRAELKKGPYPFSIAHWAKGMHLISLGRDAVAEMQAALDYGVKQAESKGDPTTVSGDGTWMICLSAGYLGLAERLAGQESTRYAEAKAALEDMAKDEAKAGDAKFCLSQLKTVEERYPASA